MYRVASLVAVLTVVSKILGLLRDLIVAHYFGTSMQADAYNMAYLFTGNFFIIFGTIGGPFYSALVATLPKLPENKHTWTFIKDILFKTTLVLIGVVLMIYFYKSFLLKFFIDPAQQEYFSLTLLNIDILLPLVILCGPIGIIFGILNCYKKYYEPSLSPAVVNIVMIITVLMMGDAANGLALALGASLGGILSFVFQFSPLAFVRKKLLGHDSSPHTKLQKQAITRHPAKRSFASDAALKKDETTKVDSASSESIIEEKQDVFSGEYNHILVPALFSTGLSQILVFIDGFYCKGLAEGSFTSLTLANRLIQLPLGVLLTAFLVPLFPRITQLVKHDDLKEIKRLLVKAIRMLILLCIPAIVIGMIWPHEIIRLLFERGAFDERSTTMVADLFFYLCLSIIPYVLRDSFARACYSFGDARSPLVVMILSIVLKFALNSYFVEHYGLNGIAISTIIISVINALILFVILNNKFRVKKVKPENPTV